MRAFWLWLAAASLVVLGEERAGAVGLVEGVGCSGQHRYHRSPARHHPALTVMHVLELRVGGVPDERSAVDVARPGHVAALGEGADRVGVPGLPVGLAVEDGVDPVELGEGRQVFRVLRLEDAAQELQDLGAGTSHRNLNDLDALLKQEGRELDVSVVLRVGAPDADPRDRGGVDFGPLELDLDPVARLVGFPDLALAAHDDGGVLAEHVEDQADPGHEVSGELRALEQADQSGRANQRVGARGLHSVAGPVTGIDLEGLEGEGPQPRVRFLGERGRMQGREPTELAVAVEDEARGREIHVGHHFAEVGAVVDDLDTLLAESRLDGGSCRRHDQGKDHLGHDIEKILQF